MHNDLIFDIGVHTGHDALYYLKKGFRVVGLEARADLCEEARRLTIDYAESGKLQLVQRALFHRADESVTFYVNDRKDDWGSLFRDAAEQDGSLAREISVQTITLADLFAEYGTPYYAKCDIEGGDEIFVEQLLRAKERPAYVSVEMTSVDDLAKLRACGYNSFQIVNQYLNPQTKQPNPPREGVLADSYFTHAMSGLFGRDLPFEKWTDFEATLHRTLDWYDLRARDTSLAIGWLDIHATMVPESEKNQAIRKRAGR